MLSYVPSSQGFFGLPKHDAPSVKDARAVLIPFGLENSVSYGGGTAAGPSAIIKASPQLEQFDEEYWREVWRDYGVLTLKETKIKKDIPAALQQLDDLVEEVLKAKKFPFVLGGEHSITAGSIRPFTRRYKKIGILHFDAHADLRDGYDGEHFSHAAALRRVLDNKEVVQLVSIGIRNISAEEIPFLEKSSKRITTFWAKDKAKWKIADMLKPLKGLPVYLTFDIDGLDSSLMPATGTPEPGGLFWTETMEILKAAGKALNIVGADLVELAPQKNLHACDFLAAKLVYKMLSAVLAKQK